MYLLNCCEKNEDGSETYFSESGMQWVCGDCGATSDYENEDCE